MWMYNGANMLLLLGRSINYETRWLLLLLVMCDMTNGGVQRPMESYNSLEEHMLALSTTQYPPTTISYEHPKWMEPYFDPSTPRNVTALMGKSAYLSCRVRNLSNKTVSWIRHRDIHILTVGAYTYTSDQRFQATHHQDTDDWTLQIKWAQKRDAGMYECQISTQPVRSYFVRLNVVVPTASILGGPDLHVDKGSTINLTCTVKFSPEPPAYIFWYHHEEVINYDSSRGGVSVITEKGDVTTSFLLIQNADLADSGKYSCAPSNADVASVRVHVLNGEHPEAMQTGSSGCQFSWLTIFLLVGLVLCYQQQQNLAMHATGRIAIALADSGDGGACGGDSDNGADDDDNDDEDDDCVGVATVQATILITNATNANMAGIGATIATTTIDKQNITLTNNNNNNTTTNATNLYETYAIERNLLSNNERNKHKITTTESVEVKTTKTLTIKVPTNVNALTQVIRLNNNATTAPTTAPPTITTPITTRQSCCCQSTNIPTNSLNAYSHIRADLVDVNHKVEMSQSSCCNVLTRYNNNKRNIVANTKCACLYVNTSCNNNNSNIPPPTTLNTGSDYYNEASSISNNNNNNNENKHNNCINVR